MWLRRGRPRGAETRASGLWSLERPDRRSTGAGYGAGRWREVEGGVRGIDLRLRLGVGRERCSACVVGSW
jgi:hypothetical protein